MYCRVPWLAFLFLNPTSSELQTLTKHGDVQFTRNSLVGEEANVQKLVPVQILNEGQNIQKLVPANTLINDYDPELDTNLDTEVAGNLPQNTPEVMDDLNVAPENVNHIRQIVGSLWPMGIVPYFINRKIYDDSTAKRVSKAMAIIEASSCLIFRELKNKPEVSMGSWLYFTNPLHEKECRHGFEEVDGRVEVVLGFNCLRPEDILHSLLHALGFRDEVTHPQRDRYISIMWDNIQPKYRYMFVIREDDAAYKLVEYDPMSIMHFHDRAFSSNGAPTIVSKVPGLQIAHTTGLSQLDVMRLKLAFSHECYKRNIGDLLDTCKNALDKNVNKEQDGDISEIGDGDLIDEVNENQELLAHVITIWSK